MNPENHILNWLTVGISQSPNSLNESFYFDRINNEFFSILITDYFMLDENLNIAKNTSTSYSQGNQIELVNRIKRIDKEDENIIPIPRLTNSERQGLLAEFLESIDYPKTKELIENLYSQSERMVFDKTFNIDSEEEIVEGWSDFRDRVLLSKAETFLNLNNINTHSTRVWELESQASVTIDLKEDDAGSVIKEKNTIKKAKKWWEFWK